MPSGDAESPRRSPEITEVVEIASGAGVDDAIGLFRSELDSEDQAPEWTPPPTTYRPAVLEEIRPTREGGTGVLIGAAIVLLTTLLVAVFMLGRHHPSPRPPLDLTSPTARSIEADSRRGDSPGEPTISEPLPRAAAAPPATSESTPDTTPREPARKVAAAGTAATRSAATPPPAAIPGSPATPPPTSPPVADETPEVSAHAEALPPPPAMPAPSMPPAGRAVLDDIAATAVVPPPPPAAVSIDPLIGDQAAIRRTLDVYRESYSALDASAVSMIWVGLDTRALQRAFASLSRQDLAFNHCDLDISAARTTARASCTGVLNYVRRIGSADEHQRQMSWAIDLVRNSDRWLIEKVTSR
jgi:hypothetical protein